MRISIGPSVVLFFLIVCVSAASCIWKGDSELGLFPVRSENGYMYIDRRGENVIAPLFGNATVFRDDVALVQDNKEDSCWGFIDKSGKFIIEPTFKKATIFNEGIAWVVEENSPPKAIDKKGSVKFEMKEAEDVRVFGEGLASFSVITGNGQKRWGFVDKMGRMVIEPNFTEVVRFSEGKCAVLDNEKKWGYIDKKGKYVIGSKFDMAENFEGGLAVVSLNRKYGVIDKKGKYVIYPEFDFLFQDGSGFIAELDGKTGWINHNGEYVIKSVVQNVMPFNKGNLAPVKFEDGTFGYIDRKGILVVDGEFDLALPFNGSIGFVVDSGKLGIIDEMGRYILKPKYEFQADDLYNYLLSGNAVHTAIKSNRFNSQSVLPIIDFITPEGLDFDSNFGEIADLFDKNVESFSRNSGKHTLISNKEISAHINYDFMVKGTPYRRILINAPSTQRRTLFGEYLASSSYDEPEYKYKFNSSAIPKCFIYRFVLLQPDAENIIELTRVIENKVIASGFKKIRQSSNYQDFSFGNGERSVDLKLIDGKSIELSICK